MPIHKVVNNGVASPNCLGKEWAARFIPSMQSSYELWIPAYVRAHDHFNMSINMKF